MQRRRCGRKGPSPSQSTSLSQHRSFPLLPPSLPPSLPPFVAPVSLLSLPPSLPSHPSRFLLLASTHKTLAALLHLVCYLRLDPSRRAPPDPGPCACVHHLPLAARHRRARALADQARRRVRAPGGAHEEQVRSEGLGRVRRVRLPARDADTDAHARLACTLA
eukprot:3936617-Rhodomonas_salina.2